MTHASEDTASAVEEALIICATESWGILPYLDADIPDDIPAVPSAKEIAATLLTWVDRGWLTTHRIEPWTAPDGTAGAQYGPEIPRTDLTSLLADPDTWDDPTDTHWYGEVTIALTSAGREAMNARPQQGTDHDRP